MRKEVELDIDGLSHEGRGIGRLEEGKVLFVKNALPGERVRAQIARKKRHFNEGICVEVLTSSPERIEPRCPHATLCGGCSLQHWGHENQVAQKQAVLVEQLQHFGDCEPRQGYFEPVLSPPYHYRRKARLGVKYVRAKEKVLIGFREASSHFLADIENCVVLDERIAFQLTSLAAVIAEFTIHDQIPQIEVAAGDDAVALVVRHLQPFPESELQALVEYCQKQKFHLYCQPGGLKTVHRVWPEADNPQQYRLKARLDSLGIEYQFHPLDFLQVNRAVNEQLVPLAIKLLDIQRSDKVLDLFCGLGNFTMALGQASNHVLGVELSAEMVSRGRENADLNGFAHIDFACADLTHPFEEQEWFGQFDKVLIDPPRSGAQEIMPVLAKTGAKRLVYVSCNPATLARDIKLLTENGYELLNAGILDMFPHTAHVESIAVLEKR